MDKLIKQLVASAIPSNDSSIKKDDFLDLVNNLQEKIIDIFRYSSLQFLPPFLDGMLATIKQSSESQDKKTRFSTAICVAALINLFPFDDEVRHYREIIEKLLVPGYRPVVEIGAMTLGRLAKISGQNRDRFLNDLIEKSRVFTKPSIGKEVKYTAAIIWKELAHSYPEGFFILKNTFYEEIRNGIYSSLDEPGICSILIDIIKELFQSEAASIGVSFLEDLHEYLVETTTAFFSRESEPKSVIFDLLIVLLKVPPFINQSIAISRIMPQCRNCLKSANFAIVSSSINVILLLQQMKIIEESKEIEDRIFQVISDWVMRDRVIHDRVIRDPVPTEPSFISIVLQYSNENNSEFLCEKIDEILQKLPKPRCYSFAFDLCFAVLQVGKTRDVPSFLKRITDIMLEAPVPLPIDKVINVLNHSYPNWSHEFIFFKNSVIHSIRQELSKVTLVNDPTERLIISLRALLQIPSFSFIDAMELKNLILKQISSKDSELRELIVASIVHLFQEHPNQMPLNTIIDLVKFALNDKNIRVRKKSLRGFNDITYEYIEQPDVFEEFCKFSYDESPDIRKEAFNIIKNLKTFDLAAIRHLLLSSTNLISSNFGIIVPETTPVWIVFPNLLIASKPILPIYADSFFHIFTKMLNNRFHEAPLKEAALILMNSAILKEIDESLIKSVTRLFLLCPEIVPVKPILNIFCSILNQPVHPWTKENVLKSLKNIAERSMITNECPEILHSLLKVIEQKESTKLVTKSLKVLGSIGVVNIPINPKKESFFLRSSLGEALYLNRFILRVYFKHLNALFDSVNIDYDREKIAVVVAQIYYVDQGGIQDHLEPFMTKYLNFIKNSSTDRIPRFLYFLKGMIHSAGYLILPYTDKIFQAIEDHWHGKYTKEASDVFTHLVLITDGRCESILHLLVSVSFLFLRSKKELQNSAEQIFNLLKAIAKYCPSDLQSIIDGCVKIMSTPGSPTYLQQEALITIEYIIKKCNAKPHLPNITRCLNSVAMRSQMMWREQANRLLAEVAALQRENTYAELFKKSPQKQQPNQRHILHNPLQSDNAVENEYLSSSTVLLNNEDNLNTLLSLMNPPKEDNDRTHQTLQKWFEDLRTYVIQICRSDVILTMLELPTVPTFAFNYAFFTLWLHFNDEEKKSIAAKLDIILKMKNLPIFVISQFIGLVEFAMLSDIELGVNLVEVINTCISIKLYSKALFFLENCSNPNEVNDYIVKLIKMNIALNRLDEAQALANDNQEKMNISIWMSLNEWETALELINQEEDDDMIIQKIECLASIENWSEIKQQKASLLQEDRSTISKLARFMWMAEIFQGTKENAIDCAHLTGGYTVNDCIQKAILNIHLNSYHEANECVHLGWRYLASSVCNIDKHNMRQMIYHTFQAQQLHELTEVIHLKVDPTLSEETKTAWRSRLKFIKDDSFKQKELFKIRSLASDYIDPTEFAYHILISSKKHHSKSILRFIDLFFPDPDSYNAKLCKIRLLEDHSVQVKNAEELLKESSTSVNSEEYQKRINNFIGKKLLKIAASTTDLQKVLVHLSAAQKNLVSLAQVQILLALLLKDENIAVSAINDSLRKIIESNPAMTLHQLEAMTIHFPKSKNVSHAVLSVFQSTLVKTVYFKYIENSCVLSLNHSSTNVVKVAREVCSNLATQIPFSIIFDLETNIGRNPKIKLFTDLLNVLRSQNPLFYSEMSQMIEKLKMISNTLYDRWIEQLSMCSVTMAEGKFQEAFEILNQIAKTLKQTNVTRYDTTFMENLKKFNGRFLERTIMKGVLTESDQIIIDEMILAMRKKQDAVRVIPLSSLDVELGTKTDWSIPIFGKEDKTDLKMVKFFHTVQRLDNGLRISIVGSNGKKYNFHLLRQSNIHARQTGQFMNLLNALTPLSLDLRELVEISPNLTLLELLKGNIQISDLIHMYHQSKGRQTEEEFKVIEKFYQESTKKQIQAAIEFNFGKDDENDLKKAILLTSKNSTMYIHRTTMFATTMGTLAAVSYIIGGADNSPRGILINKTTGEATYAKYGVTASSQPVPFRLTRMIERSFGPCGLKGPYTTSFRKTLKGIKKYTDALAMCAQFAISDGPFEPSLLPTKYLSKYDIASSSAFQSNLSSLSANQDSLITSNFNSINDEEFTNTLVNTATLDEFYDRIGGDGKKVDQRIAHLIKEARSWEKLSLMPPSFYAWW